MPQRLHAQLLLLLAAVVAASVLAALVAVGLSTRESNAERIARILHAQVSAADALLASPDAGAAAAELDRLGIARSAHPLTTQARPGLPLLLHAKDRLHARLPGRALRLSGEPPTLWVRARVPEETWIGIPMLGEADPFRRGVLLSLVAIGALVVVAGGLFARSLTRPLRRLAEAAPGIVAGETPPPASRFASREIHDLRASLAASAERTREAARERELMLAGISHDLRTLLARLRYALALSEEEGLDTESRIGMERDIDALDAIVGQFIDYVRDGRDEPAEILDLSATLRELAADEARRGHEWRLAVPEAAPLRARPLALRRALGNLLDNAARHGAAPFEVALEAAGDGHGWRLCVRDRGPGVPDAELADLGRPFHRVDRARGTTGSGLGLAGAARVAATHRGALRLCNRPEGGLEAELRLRDTAD